MSRAGRGLSVNRRDQSSSGGLEVSAPHFWGSAPRSLWLEAPAPRRSSWELPAPLSPQWVPTHASPGVSVSWQASSVVPVPPSPSSVDCCTLESPVLVPGSLEHDKMLFSPWRWQA